MASIFTPSQFNVDYEKPVDDRSSSVFSSIGTSLMKGLSTGLDAIDRAERSEAAAIKASQPSYTERKDIRESQLFDQFTVKLNDIYRDPSTNEINRQLKIKGLILNAAREGLDTNDPNFLNVVQGITGGTIETYLPLDPSVSYLNKVLSTENGAARVALNTKELELKLKRPPTSVEIVDSLLNDEAKEIEMADLTINSDADLLEKLPTIREELFRQTGKMLTSIEYLKDKGIPITDRMIEGTYGSIVDFKQKIYSTLKYSASAEQRAKLDRVFDDADEFFINLGMTKQDGAMIFTSPDVLDAEEKVEAYLKAVTRDLENKEALNAGKDKGRGESVVSLLTLSGILNGKYRNDPGVLDKIIAGIDSLEGAVPSLFPEEFVKADLIVVDSIPETYDKLRNYFREIELEPNTKRSLKERGKLPVLVSSDKPSAYLKPKDRDKWINTEPLVALGNANFFAETVTKITKENLKDPTLAQAAFTNMAGLALSLETVGESEELISFNGLKSMIGPKLVKLSDYLYQADAIKGEASSLMMLKSIAGMKFKYDQSIEARTTQRGLPVQFNGSTYELIEENLKGNSQENAIVMDIVKNVYGGDLLSALKDGFRDGMAKKEYRETVLAGTGGSSRIMRQIIDTSYQEIQELADLQASSNLLNSFANSISPQTYKDFVKTRDKIEEQEIKLREESKNASDVLLKKAGYEPTVYDNVIENNEGTLKGSTKTPMVVARGIESKPDAWIFGGSDIEFDLLPMDKRISVVANWKDGQKYEGQVVNGKPDGLGTKTSSTGTVWTGTYRQGSANGQGVFTDKQGQKWYGEWKNGAIYNADWSDQPSDLFPNGVIITNGKWVEPSSETKSKMAKIMKDEGVVTAGIGTIPNTDKIVEEVVKKETNKTDPNDPNYDPDMQFTGGSGMSLEDRLRDAEPEDQSLNDPDFLDSQQGEEVLPALKEDSSTQILLREKEANSYDTLYANAESTETPFKGLKITTWTLGELIEFSRPSDAYGTWVKPLLPEDSEAAQNNDTSTPMGKYQIVGTTLRKLVKQGKWDLNTLFNKETQDKLFLQLIKGEFEREKSNEGRRKALRKQFEGFRGDEITDEMIDKIIIELESSLN